MFYIINNSVKFCSDKRMLTSRDGKKQIVLLQPDSNCLEVLIENRGTIVPQDDLIKKAWGEERSRVITLNAFYQSVLRVRKALVQIDSSADDVIETVPRCGLVIRKDIEVVNASQTAHNAFMLGKIRAEKLLDRSIARKASIFLFPAILLMVGFFMYIESFIFADYTLAISFGSCSVYSNFPLSPPLTRFLQKKLQSGCTGKKDIYIPKTSTKEWVSLFICPTSASPGNECRSELYIGNL